MRIQIKQNLLYAVRWPHVPTTAGPIRLEALLPLSLSRKLGEYNIHTVQDLLSRAPLDLRMIRDFGPKKLQIIWQAMERLAGVSRKPQVNLGRAKLDVTQLAIGFITMSRQQGNPAKKSRNPKLFWLGPVPIQAAVRSFITQTLTELHILPNAQLLAELEVEVLTTTSRGGAFVFNGAHGRVSIVLRWNKAGNELFVEVKSQAPGQKTTNITRHVFYYEDKAKMLEIKVGPVVRRLAATIGSLQKTGIPGPEIRDFIKKRLPTI